MSCTDCESCSNTWPMNICHATLSVGTFAADTDVTLTFVNMADEAVLTAEGTTDGDGLLTIDSEDLPSFVQHVTYKLTASEEWDKPTECLFISFRPIFGGGEWVVSPNEVVTVC